MELLIEQALETFRQQFPLIKVVADDDSLRYVLYDDLRAFFYEDLANRIILINHLPLEVNVSKWSSARRGIYETTIEIKAVPEMHHIPGY